jgi:hypothetical protein
MMYELVGEIPGFCRLLAREPHGEWVPAKILFDKPYAAYGKRRAWFWWHIKERRPSDSTTWLRETSPDVYAWAIDALAAWAAGVRLVVQPRD